jgi:hypothetical protein
VTTSLLRHRLEASLGDVPSDSKTFYYRYVGGFVATGWAAVVRIGPWRRTPESAFSGFLTKVAEEEEKKRDVERPYATAEKVCGREAGQLHLDCSECHGAGEFYDHSTGVEVCPSCGGGGTAFHEEVTSAEQKCLSALDRISCPPTQPAPPEKV